MCKKKQRAHVYTKYINIYIPTKEGFNKSRNPVCRQLEYIKSMQTTNKLNELTRSSS